MGNNSHPIPSVSLASQAEILIVDGVLENLRLLSTLLDRLGYYTRKATNSSMALKSIEAALPNLILLGSDLPDVSSYDLCRHLKANPAIRHIPIIFLSADDDVAQKVEVFRVGGADYITKPLHVDEVRARVHHQLALVNAQHMIGHLKTQLKTHGLAESHPPAMDHAFCLDLASYDPLTRLPNRTLLRQRLWQELDLLKSDPIHSFVVFYLDCDRFAQINETLGHRAGDELLVAIAHRLHATMRQRDFLARSGGDEFVLVLPHLQQVQTVITIAERILNRFATPFYLHGQAVTVSLNIGIVTTCLAYQEPDQILQAADIARYQAKHSGGDRYHILTSTPALDAL